MKIDSRIQFASRLAVRHLFISGIFAVVCGVVVFLFLYPNPFGEMFRVNNIYILILVVDVICGPCLTLLVVNPRKSRRETRFDFGFIVLIQISALAYGTYSVWLGRPVILAFEKDRFTVVSALEVDVSDLANAPLGFRQLPLFGVLKVATRDPANNIEFFNSIELSLNGLTPAMRPSWWVPIETKKAPIRQHAKPLALLMDRRPEKAHIIIAASQRIGYKITDLLYLPLTNKKTQDWIILLDSYLNIVGYAEVDGFK